MLLIDKFYQKLHTPWAKEWAEKTKGSVKDPSLHRHKTSEYFSSFRDKVERADRYILDNSALLKVLGVKPVDPEYSAGQMSAAGPKRPLIWIEYDNRFKLKNQRHLPMFSYGSDYEIGEAPVTVGWLIETHPMDEDCWAATAVTEEANGEIAIFPMALMFNSRGDFAPMQVGRIDSLVKLTGQLPPISGVGTVWDNWRAVAWGYSRAAEGHLSKVPLLPSCLHDCFSLGVDSYLLRLYAEAALSKSTDPQKEVMKIFALCAEQSGGDAMLLTTLLALLNEVPPTVQVERTPGVFRGIHNTLQNLEHKVVTIVIPKRARVQWLTNQVHHAAHLHAKKRRHVVEPHKRVLYRGTEAERVVNVRSHERGDERIGRVVKTFKVVGEQNC